MKQEKQALEQEMQISAYASADEIDIKEIIVALIKQRKFIAKVTGIALLLGICVALALPTKYTAQCTIVPQLSEKGGGSNLSGLASLAGINLGSNIAGNVLSPTIYPEIIKSIPFTRVIMETPITVAKAGGEKMTLYEFYANKKYNRPGILDVIKKYTLELPGVIISIFKKKDSTATTLSSTPASADIETLSGKDEAIYNTIQSNISLEVKNKEGYLKLRYTFPEPEGAAQVTARLQKTLEQFVTAYKLEKVQDEFEFVEKSYQEARRDFLAKQSALAAFQDANRRLATATGHSVERRLSSEYDIAFSVYNELAKQREQARLALKENKPILTVVNPVVVPTKKSGQSKSLIITVFLLLGVITSSAWVLIKPFLKEIRRNTQQADNATTEEQLA